jgi:hypothetical protein
MERLCVAAFALFVGIKLSQAQFLSHDIAAAVLLLSVPFLIAKGTGEETRRRITGSRNGTCTCSLHD